MTINYTPKGVCANHFTIDVENGVIQSVKIDGGCPGNTQGVARLVVGRKIRDVIRLLKGIQCRGGTSCPDQLARALEADLTAEKGIVI